MKNLRDLEINDLKKLLEEMGEKPFRAKQIYTWLHQNLVEHYDEMTNISKGLRDRLSAEYSVALPETVEVLTSKIDGTKKFIFRMQDGHVIESVWMEYSTDTVSASPRRSAAAWAVSSVPRPSTASHGI